ncbi:hypothetical protein [Planomicrobium okeanokoites]|uniref:Uncharacterized protein n=1 Tax=Planomicrobium okeanokoites TaxID=244 RepID=A0ABV7KTZ6_PLAOK|nr:hypothetical protein [Planomicrobium okeanokoites]TAA71611.1 hypothetical protein D2910_04860 [Planomicrobium okeanokoites]
MTIKQNILKIVEANIDAQNAKGMATYGKPLEACSHDSYDWNDMASQELIDALQYQQMEIKKVKRLNMILEKENQQMKQIIKGGI